MNKNVCKSAPALVLIVLTSMAVVFIQFPSSAQDDYKTDSAPFSQKGPDMPGAAREENLYQSSEDALIRQDQKQTALEEPGKVTIEQIKPGEWKIINKYGDFVGTLKSESKEVFQFYDTEGLFMGKIIESGVWFPRQYRSRETKIVSREVFLYLDALDAIEEIKITP